MQLRELLWEVDHIWNLGIACFLPASVGCQEMGKTGWAESLETASFVKLKRTIFFQKTYNHTF